MTDCNDINKRLDEIEAEEKRLNELEAQYKANIEGIKNKKKKGGGPRRTLKDMDGNNVGVAGQDWWDQVEKDNIARGGEDIKNLVQEGFTKKKTPTGDTGEMINFAQLPPTEQNFESLLVVLGLKRTKTKKGVELMRPFTQQIASQAALSLAKTVGGDPRALATMMKNKLRGIDQLPVNIYTAARLRRESSAQYADALDGIADLISVGAVTDAEKAKLANIAQWAHFFEQIDAQARRKMGQAFRSLQMGDDDGIRMLDFDRDASALSWDDITGGSLLAQVYDHIQKGDVQRLKRIATAKRMGGILDTPLNQPNFWTEAHILNQLRKDNLFAAIGSWGLRNPMSVMVGFYTGATDIVEGALRIGVADELKVTGQSLRAVWAAQKGAWDNAVLAFTDGKATMGGKNLKDISPETLAENKLFVDGAFDRSYELLFGPNNKEYLLSTPLLGQGVSLWNLVNAATRKVIADKLEFELPLAGKKALGLELAKRMGNSAPYTMSFRALNWFDEGLRTSVFSWATQHEAMVRGYEEAAEMVKAGILPAKDVDRFVIQNADELTENALFKGTMSEEDIIKLRREIGVPLGENLSNRDLMMKHFNDLAGVPNLSDEFGRLGKQRGDDVTFTTKRRDKFNVGMQIARQNPLIEWLLPVWNVLSNGVSWTVNADAHLNMVKLGLDELANAGGFISPEQIRKTRANAIVSGSLLTGTALAWKAGFFTDGGPFNPEENKRWRETNVPYSFNLLDSKLSGRGIDFVDVMGLQVDLMRAWHEGLLDGPDVQELIGKIGYAYMRVIDNKTGVYNLVQIGDFINSQGQRQDVAKILASQTNGILPYSGLMSNVARGFSDPSKTVQKRRFPTSEELAAIEADPIYQILAPGFNFIQQVSEQAVKNVPIANQIVKAPRQYDWKGTKIERPLGLPFDLATPFMPQIKPKDPLYDWEQKHGFGRKPLPTNEIEGVTMTNDEEDIFREHMRTYVAEIPAALVIRSESNTIMGNIDKYVRGRSLRDALRALSVDPAYNAELAKPNSPSLSVQKRAGRSLSDRTASIQGRQVHKPYEAIVSYYAEIAKKYLYDNSPSFRERVNGVLDEKQRQGIQWLESFSLGVGRQ